MYKNNILISLIFRPLELIQVNKRSRLQPEQSNNQGYNVQLQNLTLKYDIINYVNKVLSDEERYDALKKITLSTNWLQISTNKLWKNK